ncbi:hypothetical protein NVP1206O_29 [Vibrio phage 1.206.O._10N.222.51.B10]|nr:hypothetical protein NVP1206O_29 [Vibrio phage 1.206.O._10N.222.51.B10]
MEKFSKGPWFVRWGGDCRAIKTSEGTLIMGNERYYPWTPKSGHDWNLIASAPEMYEMLTTIESMLNGMVGEHHYDGNLHREIESLLAKARGESEAN